MKDRRAMTAEIVAVGDEILLGGLVDTNTAWLSRRLADLGVAVLRHTTVGDDKECLGVAFSEAASRADLVVSTGGLGPTPDDLTHEALGLATGRGLVEYPEARRHVDETFERFTGRMPPPLAYKQARFPEGSELVANPLGTAMGALLELEGALFATFPGVPKEMEGMFEGTLGLLIGERSEGAIVSVVLRFAGISEEEISEELRELLAAPQSHGSPSRRSGRSRKRRGPTSRHHQGPHARGGRGQDRAGCRGDPLPHWGVPPVAYSAPSIRADS